jgi:hypothetical protein
LRFWIGVLFHFAEWLAIYEDYARGENDEWSAVKEMIQGVGNHVIGSTKKDDEWMIPMTGLGNRRIEVESSGDLGGLCMHSGR